MTLLSPPLDNSNDHTWQDFSRPLDNSVEKRWCLGPASPPSLHCTCQNYRLSQISRRAKPITLSKRSVWLPGNCTKRKDPI
ncbi:hypothetical protein IMY05_001G0271300 [Salix suchowensis]|nr:hypothetical protein IMY05_001G0271300 [Salix suchowensis]